MGSISTQDMTHIIHTANERGRDGFGFWFDGYEFRSVGKVEDSPFIIEGLPRASCVLGNFRATPTTEAESLPKLLQPYEGIVHNGTIANDKDFGDFPIDSMVLPVILKDRGFGNTLLNSLSKIKGSYALAYFDEGDLILAVNYKPIYFISRPDGFMFASTPDMLPGPSSFMTHTQS
jgi:asparagine synthetase B (glutamine-hydrolysing)